MAVRAPAEDADAALLALAAGARAHDAPLAFLSERGAEWTSYVHEEEGIDPRDWAIELGRRLRTTSVAFLVYGHDWNVWIHDGGEPIGALETLEGGPPILVGDVVRGATSIGLPPGALTAYAQCVVTERTERSIEHDETIRAFEGDRFQPRDEWAHLDLARRAGITYPTIDVTGAPASPSCVRLVVTDLDGDVPELELQPPPDVGASIVTQRLGLATIVGRGKKNGGEVFELKRASGERGSINVRAFAAGMGRRVVTRAEAAGILERASGTSAPAGVTNAALKEWSLRALTSRHPWRMARAVTLLRATPAAWDESTAQGLVWMRKGLTAGLADELAHVLGVDRDELVSKWSRRSS